MQFVSIWFLLLTALLLIVYYRVPQKAQWVVLLGASCCFYLWAGVEYLAFLLFTTLSTYVTTVCMARNLEEQQSYLAARKDTLTREEAKQYKAIIKRENRVWLTLCLTLNFTILALCKACLTEPLRAAVGEGRLSFLALGLPLGISFYMFQSMGYVIDVYRGTVQAERNPFKLALFVCYFPQLIQGPISKYSQLAPQLLTPHGYDGKQVSFGAQRMLWGYFKKLVIADRIAVAVAALKGPEHTGISFLVLTVFYAVQIYGDFTGGIDIALGLSEMLGIRLPENFLRPFFSKNIAEYWRRWHITLGAWMKDYIFYPISVCQPMRRLSKAARAKLGSLGKRLPVYGASIATWFATGIWHGLTPNFVVWGMLNCLVIVVSEEMTPLYQRFHDHFHFKEKRWYGVLEMLRMFFLMNLIRACDLFPDVGEYFFRIATVFSDFQVPWNELSLTGLDYIILGLGCGLMLAVSLVQEKRGSIRELLWRHTLLRYALVFALFVTVLLMGSYGIGYDAGSFIYNQF